MKRMIWIFNGFCLGLLLLSGCGDGAGVSGEVTYEGQLVEKGNITFFPADGKGQPAGATILKGKYNLDELPPGPKVVKIGANKEQVLPRSSLEMSQKMATQRRTAKSGTSAQLIPPDAVGNNSTVELAVGKQKLDFHLTKPASK